MGHFLDVNYHKY